MSWSINKLIHTQRSLKWQKIEVASIWNELDRVKTIRHRTFSIWPHPALFRSRMIDAGFFGCNVGDRVICIYCDLICQHWNIETDDPCEVHKILSPNCVLVKSIFHCDSLHHNHIVSTVPSYIDYVDPKKRSASFCTWYKKGFPSTDKLVDAGFFFNGSKIICFYCNGSFDNWELNNHPIAEHVRWFPYCNYARQLCGEDLYHKIQRAIKHMSENVRTSEFKNDHHRSSILDDSLLLRLVADYLDLPVSIYLLEVKKIERSIVERCLKDQLQHRYYDFIDGCDLSIRCEIIKKQIEHIEIKKKDVVIPSIALKELYQNRQQSCNGEQSSLFYVWNNTNQSYPEILKSFEDNLQSYKRSRQKLGAEFTEQLNITIEREKSLKNWSCIKPSQYDLTKGGWILYGTEDYSKCPHCHIYYYNWKPNDNPLVIHKYLSPLCLFVLALNPFNSNPIPIRTTKENFTDENIIDAESQPYDGLVQTRYESVFMLSKRQKSFETFPGGCPINAHELAISGWYYPNTSIFIKCFYCKRSVPAIHSSLRPHPYLKDLHRLFPCRYVRQLNDIDSQLPIQQVSHKCTWCMVGEKRLVALPCRHFCLCESCGLIKRLCPHNTFTRKLIQLLDINDDTVLNVSPLATMPTTDRYVALQQRQRVIEMLLQKIEMLRERLTRKEDLLHDYENDLGKLRQAEILLREKDFLLQDLETDKRSKDDEALFLRNTLKETEDHLNQEKRLNSSIKHGRNIDQPQSNELIRRSGTSTTLQNRYSTDPTTKVRTIKRDMNQKICRKDYEIKTLKQELHEALDTLSEQSNKVKLLELQSKVKRTKILF
ncbi:unnamed protein product [Rotaria sp. Silwood2]|nr:unnamed protein product [Rotaria sp. Silwood2]